MNVNQSDFPLKGVIGIIANGRDEIHQAQSHGLQCVEVRPDLLLDSGISLSEVMAMVGEIASLRMQCLFTMRRHDHGGKFTGSDREQMDICIEAVTAGANVVDIEWDSGCAEEIIGSGMTTILSYHNFSKTPSDHELDEITNRIAHLTPSGIKLIPTANTFEDTVRILKWVSNAEQDLPRIGFAMGQIGEYSRILAPIFGSPITYAGFSEPIAPGQIAVRQLLSDYHVQNIHRATRFIGVSASKQTSQTLINRINRSRRAQDQRIIAVPIQFSENDSTEQTTLKTESNFLKMDYLISPNKSPKITRLPSPHIGTVTN